MPRLASHPALSSQEAYVLSNFVSLLLEHLNRVGEQRSSLGSTIWLFLSLKTREGNPLCEIFCKNEEN